MSKTTHTPLPWNKERPFGEPGVYISGPNTGLIAKLYEPDPGQWQGDKLATVDGNAELIVRAVNSHAELVAAAEDACVALGQVPDLLLAQRNALHALREAIAKAEGARSTKEERVNAKIQKLAAHIKALAP